MDLTRHFRPGERDLRTWAGSSRKDHAGVNVWNSPAVGIDRGIVYLGFGTTVSDRDGSTRIGAGLSGTSLVALDARTGRYVWHFQTVHHDLWSRDITGTPMLLEVRRGGKVIPAVAAINKQALLFVLDWVTGKPLFPSHETPVPPSEAPGEHAWPTQPYRSGRSRSPVSRSTSPPTSPTSRRSTRLVPQLDQAARPVRNDALYPDRLHRADHVSFRLRRRNEVVRRRVRPAARALYRQHRQSGQRRAAPPHAGRSVADDVLRQQLVRRAPAAGALQCQKGRWGEIMAADVATGATRWRHSLGITDRLPAGKRETGRANAGGPIVTTDGLVFIAATDADRFRAFDAATDQQLWEAWLDAAGHATPLTYLGAGGRQYLALIATGGSNMGDPPTSDDLVSYALADRPRSLDGAGTDYKAPRAAASGPSGLA